MFDASAADFSDGCLRSNECKKSAVESAADVKSSHSAQRTQLRSCRCHRWTTWNIQGRVQLGANEENPEFSARDHKIVVVAGPCDSSDQCDEQLKWMQRTTVVSYANGLVELDSGKDFTSYSDEEIDDRLVSRHYEGPVTVGGETKYEKVVQLAFTPKIQSEIRQAAKGIKIGRRLKFLAFVGTLGTVLLICSGGLLGLASRRIS